MVECCVCIGVWECLEMHSCVVWCVWMFFIGEVDVGASVG